MPAIYWIQLLITLGVIADMYRRPESQWALADRQRFFWAALLAVCGLIGAGWAASLVYLFLVIPKLTSAGTSGLEVSEAFRKPRGHQ